MSNVKLSSENSNNWLMMPKLKVTMTRRESQCLKNPSLTMKHYITRGKPIFKPLKLNILLLTKLTLIYFNNTIIANIRTINGNTIS